MASPLLYLLLPLPLVAPAYFLTRGVLGSRRAARAAIAAAREPMQRLAASVFEGHPGVSVTTDERGAQAAGERDGLPVSVRLEYRAHTSWWGHGTARNPENGWKGMIEGSMIVTGPPVPSRHFALRSNAAAARDLEPRVGTRMPDHELRKMWHVTGDLALDDELRRVLVALQLEHPYTDFAIHSGDGGLTAQWRAHPEAEGDWASAQRTVSAVLALGSLLRQSGRG